MTESIDWQAESLRITAFPIDMADVSAEQMWDICIGTPPADTRIQRTGVETREVEYCNGRIFLIKQIDRIDWRYHVQEDAGDVPSNLPIIGDFSSELRIMQDLAKNWIESGNDFPMNRLAFAAVLLHPVESVGDGYEILGKLLPSLNLENIKDLSYQVNRPRMSKVIQGISINRLSRWNVIRSQIFEAVPSAQLRLQSTADEKFACRLEFDVNSTAERIAPIRPDLLLELLHELVSNGLELSEYGDVL